MTEIHHVDDSPIEYRTPTGAYHAYHDFETEAPLSATVLEAFDAVAGPRGDATPDSPLYDSLDVTAIDALFRATDGRGPRTQGHLTVVHDGYEIEVHTSGLVSIRPPSTGRRAEAV